MKASQGKHFKICLPICYLQECMLVYALLTLSWQKAGKAFYWTSLKRSSLGILLCDILLVSLKNHLCHLSHQMTEMIGLESILCE